MCCSAYCDAGILVGVLQSKIKNKLIDQQPCCFALVPHLVEFIFRQVSGIAIVNNPTRAGARHC